MKRKIMHIVSVKALENYHLEIVFEDGLKKIVSIKQFIKNGKSKELADESIFKSVHIDYGTVVFKNDYDLCPVVLREMI